MSRITSTVDVHEVWRVKARLLEQDKFVRELANNYQIGLNSAALIFVACLQYKGRTREAIQRAYSAIKTRFPRDVQKRSVLASYERDLVSNAIRFAGMDMGQRLKR